MAANGNAAPTVIAWDYQFAPNAQKARNMLHAAGVPYKQCDQPFVLPRPILTNLGITYRRVPVLSIGKDVYCDNKVIVSAVQDVFKDKALVTGPADNAFEAFGYRSFWLALPLVDAGLVTPDLSKDRFELFSVFSRPDFAQLRTNSLGEMKSMLDMVENDFLAHGKPWIAGDKCGVADIHAIWIIKWCFQTLGLGNEPGFDKQSFPRVYRWIEGLPPHDDNNRGEQISADEATKLILDSPYGVPSIGVDKNDPLGIAEGTPVTVETNDDAKPGNNPQKGKLVGLGRREIVVELDNGLRVHFPRVGYVVKKA